MRSVFVSHRLTKCSIHHLQYNLKSNDAILAGEEHMPIYKDIVDNYKIAYVAGGAAQNAARCAQYVLPANSTAYFGAVGDDDLADQLRAANDKEGLHSAYQVVKGTPTGSCAVIITGHDRSLCTNLGAAEKFDKSHLASSESKKLIDGAKYFYMGGFFLTHGVESGLQLAQTAVEKGALFSLNLSAPFIAEFFNKQLDTVLPYTELVFGNESEAESYAKSHGLDTKDVAKIAQSIADFENKTGKQRKVIITQGADPTIVAVSGGSSPKTIPTAKIDGSKIIDTNGAGDAFAGGVIGAIIAGKSLDEAVAVGQKLGGLCITQVGPVLPFPKQQVL